LNVLEVRVPSLAEREEDVMPLAQRFAVEAAARHRLAPSRLSHGALRAVVHATWPGNVRELANRVEAAVLQAHLRGASSVEAQDLFPDEVVAEEAAQTLQEATRQFQKRHVLSVLEEEDWNVSGAARRLGIARSHLYNLIGAHGLKRDR
jgi:Nif-specific regulatory protein